MTTQQITCRKCSGTGTVTRFLDYEGGVCFDCNGTGRIRIAGQRKAKRVRARFQDLEVGMQIRSGRPDRPEVETVVELRQVGRIIGDGDVITAEGNTYELTHLWQSPITFA